MAYVNPTKYFIPYTGNTIDIGTSFNGPVYHVFDYQAGILCFGNFTTYFGTPVANFCKLNYDGSLDTSFNRLKINTTDTELLHPKITNDGHIILHAHINPATHAIYKYNSLGNLILTTTFTHEVGLGSNYIVDVDIQSDGKYIVCGYFEKINNTTVPTGLMRINSDGSIDSTYNNGGVGFGPLHQYSYSNDGVLNAWIDRVTDKVILTHGLVTYNNATAPELFRINTNGTKDTTFTYPNTGYVTPELVVQRKDNKYYFNHRNSALFPSPWRIGFDVVNLSGATYVTGTGYNRGLDTFSGSGAETRSLYVEDSNNILVVGNGDLAYNTGSNYLKTWDGARLKSASNYYDYDGAIGFAASGTGQFNGVISKKDAVILGGTFTSYSGDTAKKYFMILQNNEGNDLPHTYVSNITCSDAYLSWDNVPGTTGTTIQKWISTGFTTYGIYSSGVTGVTITGLTSNITSQFRVINNVSGTLYTSFPRGILTYDATPHDITGDTTNFDGDIPLTWILDCSYLGDSIEIRYKLHSDSSYTTQASIAHNATGYTLTGLLYDSTYDVVIVLIDGVNEYISEVYTFTTPSDLIPAFLAYKDSTCDGFTLTWVNNSFEQGIFIVRWYPVTGGTITLQTLPSGTTATTITGLTPNQTYNITVSDYSGGTYYESVHINAVTLTPLALSKSYIRPEQCGPFDKQLGRIYYELANFDTGHTYSFYVYDNNGNLYYSKTGITSNSEFLLDNMPSGCYTSHIVDELYGITCPLIIDSCIESFNPFNHGGIKRLWIAGWNTSLDYNYWSTADDDYFLQSYDTSSFISTKIKEYYSTLAINWYSIPVAPQVIKLDQKLLKVRQGYIFENTLNFAIADANAFKWLRSNPFLKYENKVIFILEDNNNQYWTGGYLHGARVYTYNFTSGNRGEDNGYQLTMTMQSENKILTSIDYQYVLDHLL
jgi:hypothetical protein